MVNRVKTCFTPEIFATKIPQPNCANSFCHADLPDYRETRTVGKWQMKCFLRFQFHSTRRARLSPSNREQTVDNLIGIHYYPRG
jgi:hypothetical protein